MVLYFCWEHNNVSYRTFLFELMHFAISQSTQNNALRISKNFPSFFYSCFYSLLKFCSASTNLKFVKLISYYFLFWLFLFYDWFWISENWKDRRFFRFQSGLSFACSSDIKIPLIVSFFRSFSLKKLIAVLLDLKLSFLIFNSDKRDGNKFFKFISTRNFHVVHWNKLIFWISVTIFLFPVENGFPHFFMVHFRLTAVALW
jgi:hypothetical protein